MAYIEFEQLEQLNTAVQDGPEFHWSSAADSHIGHVYELNEDAFLNSPEQALWAVADGMGGLARGDYASGLVAESLLHFQPTRNLANNIRDLEMRLRRAHSSCRGSFNGERVGSTVAALYVHRHYAFFLWAGDSRIYRLREGTLTQLTTDHTRGQEKYQRGELTKMQAMMHPTSHILTRAVGVHQTLHLDLEYAEVKDGDRYLLCSDGLYNGLKADDIKGVLTASNAREAISVLIEKALKEDGKDNITVMIVDAERHNQ